MSEKDIKEYINQIEIDLPSIDDIKALRDAYTEEIEKYYGEKDEFRYNLHTDLADLTGKYKYNRYCYLRDINDDNEYRILYDFEGTITSDDLDENEKLKNTNRYCRKFLIRPVLSFDKCPELFDLLPFERKDENGNDLKYSKINLGWYPRYAYTCKKPYQNDLHSLPDLKQTEEVFTFDSIYVYGKNNYKKPFKPVTHLVYERKGKKYINYQVNQCKFLGDALDRMLGLLTETITLSNGEKYYNRDDLFLEVTQIPWIVDIERKVLIAKEGLLSGIQFENFDKDKKTQTPVDYNNSNVKCFLNKYMKYEMLRNEELLKNISIKIETSTTSKVTRLLDEIKKYKKYYFGNIDIESKVKDLLNNYNNELSKLSGNIDNEPNKLSIEINNPKLLYQRLILDLEEILFELKTHGEKVKNYHDMIDILNECRKYEIDINKDELCNIINTIKTVIIEFINNEDSKNKLKNELDEIITKNINQNKLHIEEFKHNDNIRIKSLDELKLDFRRDLQPYIKNRLLDIVKKQDIVNEIMSNVKIMIDNHYTESKNKLVSNYLKLLNSIISEIKEIGTEEDINNLKIIIDLDFDVNDDINNIMRKLESMIIASHKIKLDIEERQMKNKEIDDLKIKFDISNVFEEKNNTK